ncbi:MAG: DUF4041 domain-containing protein [Propionibacteriaceae bacterium]|nr:DUF4041 domain-containing protein [Propionibacteriaceae bacterium]
MNQPMPPAWYPDPQNPEIMRWWSGQGWTEHTSAKQDVPATPQMPAQKPRRITQNPAPSPKRPVMRAKQSTSTQAPEPKISVAKILAEKIPVFGANKKAEELQTEVHQLQTSLNQLGGMEYNDVQQAIATANKELATIQSKISSKQTELQSLESEIVNVRATVGLQEAGFFDFDHPAESSADLAADLAAVRQEIKYAISDNQATTANGNFTFNSSLAQGKKFVDQLSKAMLAYYNAVSENCVKTVRAGNLKTAQIRLDKAIELVAKNGAMISLRVTPTFHRLRSRELGLAARHLEAVQREKEIERERRAEQREAEKAERELRAEKDKLEKERQHYLNALDQMRIQNNEAGIADMESKIADCDRAINDVDFRVANIRAGYVYVISNIGAFGPGVVKIGMTRRLKPEDRIRELGGSSVPFRYDTHALFFAEDAVGIETALHHTFAAQRINKTNAHREFFRVTPADVLRALKDSNVHVVEYAVEPTAEEFVNSGGDILTGVQSLPPVESHQIVASTTAQ